jgi:enoyl-CoA hydratase/carnithine racemase
MTSPVGRKTTVATPVRRNDEDGIATLVLDAPMTRNALGEAMMSALAAHFTAIAADPAVRVVLLAAEGPTFCAGHDLKELTAHRADGDGGRAYFERVMGACCGLMRAIVELPQPVVAAVQGVATAAGCQLVASCDLALASTDARFQTPGVDIGLFCSTPMVALTRNVGPKQALEMLFTGEAIDADHAARIGLVNRVVAAEALRAEALALARLVASKPARTMRLGKAAFRRQATLPLADAYRLAAGVMVENLLDAEAIEGIAAFLAKRAPRWNDK